MPKNLKNLKGTGRKTAKRPIMDYVLFLLFIFVHSRKIYKKWRQKERQWVVKRVTYMRRIHQAVCIVWRELNNNYWMKIQSERACKIFFFLVYNFITPLDSFCCRMCTQLWIYPRKCLLTRDFMHCIKTAHCFKVCECFNVLQKGPV